MNSWDLGNTLSCSAYICTCHGILGIPGPEMCRYSWDHGDSRLWDLGDSGS